MGEVGRFFFDGGGGDEGGLCEPGFTRGRPRPRFRRLGVALAGLVGGETGAQPETLKLASPATPVFVADDNPQLSAPSMGVTTTHAAFSAAFLFLCAVLESPPPSPPTRVYHKHLAKNFNSVPPRGMHPPILRLAPWGGHWPPSNEG